MPDLVGSGGDGSKNSIDVKGDRNQVIKDNSGTAIANVQGDVYLNQQPKFLSLHQLPSDIADFTGRTAEIETIRQQLLGGKSLVISAVAGMAGVGKSALAIHVAQQLAESDYPEVQLYVDLRGADGDGLEPGAVLARWLRAFGLDESNMPIDLPERASVYRSQLAGKRAIVLLDNARDEAQVRPLLPGNGCAVIITSRRVLGALDGATVLNLQVLSDPEAWDLLAKLVGVERLEAEPEEAAETIRLCGGLPLAIRIVGGTLKQKLHWSLAEYCQKLRDEKARLAYLELSDLAVRASFELSYRELSAADGMLFSRLGILVGKDFGMELAALVQESEHPVIEGIERLIDAQLLEVNADRRYCFHDLLRLFAREKLAETTSAEDREGIKQKIVDWGYELSEIMNICLRPMERRQMVQEWSERGLCNTNFDEQDLVLSSLRWFEQEREQLLGAIDWAMNSARWDIVISFVSALVVFLDKRSYWYDLEKICLIAVVAADKGGDLRKKAHSLNSLGATYKLLNRLDEAIVCFQQSSIIKNQLGDIHGECISLYNIGVVYRLQYKLNEAVDCALISLSLYQELGDRYGESGSYNSLGNTYKLLGQYDEAIEYFEKSLIISQDLGDYGGESGSFYNLGDICLAKQAWDDAIDFYQKSLIISLKFGDRHGEAKVLGSFGLVYTAKKEWDKAIEYFEKALTIDRELGDREMESISLNNLGNVYRSQSRWDDAINCYQQSLSITRELGNRHGEGQTLGNLGLLYKQQYRVDLAIPLWQEALTKFPEGSADYLILERLLETDRRPPNKS